MKGTAEVLQQGRITIPASVRRTLELKQGDFVIIDVQPLKEGEDG